jgi:multiple sugar transport system permease protein
MTVVGEKPVASRASGRRRAGLTRRWMSDRRLPYLLVLPALVFELMIHVFPLLAGVGISFLGLNQFFIRNWTAAPFEGVGNYKIALDFGSPIGDGLLHSFLIIAGFMALVISMALVMGIGAALLVNSEFRGRNWFRTLFLIPYALPVYVAVIAWSFMLDRDNGALNALVVDNLHLVDHRPFWLIGTNAFWSIVMTTVWRLWPFAFLMVLAALQNIPRELYEAAELDGAGRVRQFRYMTLPQLKPVTSVLVIIMFLWTFNEFNTAYVLFGKAPPSSADLLSLHIYVNSFIDLNFGLGSAMSVLLLVFLLFATLISLRLFRVGGGKVA